MPSLSISTVADEVFFTALEVLPRGRHGLPRERVLAIQRERIMVATTELVAAFGYRAVGVGEIAQRAGVSRSAFYDCFASKELCVFAGYDRFIDVLLRELAERTARATDWDSFVEGIVSGYLQTLDADLVVARAFQVEMDAMGLEARERRRASLAQFSDLVSSQHARWRSVDHGLAIVAPEAYIAAVYAVRQVACDALDGETHPDLRALAGGLARWTAQSFRTATARVP